MSFWQLHPWGLTAVAGRSCSIAHAAERRIGDASWMMKPTDHIRHISVLPDSICRRWYFTSEQNSDVPGSFQNSLNFQYCLNRGYALNRYYCLKTFLLKFLEKNKECCLNFLLLKLCCFCYFFVKNLTAPVKEISLSKQFCEREMLLQRLFVWQCEIFCTSAMGMCTIAVHWQHLAHSKVPCL